MKFETFQLTDATSDYATAVLSKGTGVRGSLVADSLRFGSGNGDGQDVIAERLKRVFDFTAALTLLVMLLPLFACLAVAILLQRDGGPVIFKQNRIGRSGKIFPCLKFRSMCNNAAQRLKEILETDPDARAEWEATHKLMRDPRVTKIGAFLRATSLDELPQLWNVVRGEMSLVGPRPITTKELEGPYTAFNGRAEYLSVRPGLTGLWQVSGRSLVSYSNRVALDKRYVQTQSLLNDVKILFKTVSIVLLRRGAV